MKKILLQLDSDTRPSVFDRIVAFDAGADEVLAYGDVTPEVVRDLIFGAIFTRGPKDLHNTAVFIGGSDVARGEAILEQARQAFIGGLRVSLMLDSSGANTTAVAAVLCLARHLDLEGAHVLVLGGTGPVGQRVARLLVLLGARVRLSSRSLQRAQMVCDRIGARTGTTPEPVEVSGEPTLIEALDGIQSVFAAGGAGVTLLPAEVRARAGHLVAAIDLNAVPPLGIPGIEVQDAAVERNGAICYGAIGVGGTKMKIHKAAIAALFDTKESTLDAEEILAIGRAI